MKTHNNLVFDIFKSAFCGIIVKGSYKKLQNLRQQRYNTTSSQNPGQSSKQTIHELESNLIKSSSIDSLKSMLQSLLDLQISITNKSTMYKKNNLRIKTIKYYWIRENLCFIQPYTNRTSDLYEAQGRFVNIIITWTTAALQICWLI